MLGGTCTSLWYMSAPRVFAFDNTCIIMWISAGLVRPGKSFLFCLLLQTCTIFMYFIYGSKRNDPQSSINVLINLNQFSEQKIMITWELSFCNTIACSLNDGMVDWVDDLSEIIRSWPIDVFWSSADPLPSSYQKLNWNIENLAM